MKNLLEHFKEYNNNDAILGILYFDETELVDLLKKTFSMSDDFIFPHSEKNRAKRNVFFQSIINFCEHNTYEEAKELIVNKLKIAHCTEVLFDKIKESLKATDLSKQPSPVQCWAQIIRIENEIENIKKLMRESLASFKGSGDTFMVSQRLTIEYNGTSVDPDFLIEQLISSLALSLILLSHENKWFKSGQLVFPTYSDVIEQHIVAASDVTSLAIAWQKLSDTSNRCILFSGDVFLKTSEYLSEKEKQYGINEVYCYRSTFSEFEKNDFIANKRLVDRSTQN